MSHHAHTAIGEIDLLGFLLLGLLGSAAHCSIMCSPFVLLVSDRFARPGSEASVWHAQAWYTAGRIATYAALGAAAGAFGGLFQLAGDWAGVQRGAALIAGAMLVVAGASSLAKGRLRIEPHGPVFARVMRAMQRRVPSHPFALGMLLGLLPCGLLYTAVLAAVARSDAPGGALALAIFAVGTVPALWGIALLHRPLRGRESWLRVANGFVLVMGLWYLWRGFAA